MARPAPATIVNVGYRSTNYWVVSAGTSRLLVDLGWPGTLGLMKANLRRMGIPLREIRGALATHYHIDHAGLAEELKGEGIPLLVMEGQEDATVEMKTWTKPGDNYVEITREGSVALTFADSRRFLGAMGIAGEILPTPGHSAHCVSLLLDDGSVFTGDLPPEGLSLDNPEARASWALLRSRGATRIHPGHGGIRAIGAAPEDPAPDA